MADSGSMTITSPVDGRVLGEVPCASASDVEQAFTRARIAQKNWGMRVPVEERARIMLRLHDKVLAEKDTLLNLIQDESGKNRASAFDEVLDVAITARHYAFRVKKLLAPQRAKGALPGLTTTKVVRHPVGVVGIIAPWNYPLVMAISDAIPALLAGNAVILKPDSRTPLTALLIRDMLIECGLPKDLFIVVPGPGTVVGTAIANNCDFLMFTGSSQTGRVLAQKAGERLIGFSAELGGKNPLIVAPDADIDKAAKGAVRACFSNSGQLCIAIERIYIHEAVAEEFTAKFVTHVNAMRINGTTEWDTDMGSLISAEHCDRVARFVDDAVAHGARVLTGGKKLPDLGPAFYAPTVLAEVPKTAKLFREEVFGPVVALETVRTLDEAVTKANDSDYGLNASVWARKATGRKIARQLHAGTVNVNEGFAAGWGSIDAPMGGWGQSGLGRRHGDCGLTKYTEVTTIAVQRLIPIAGPDWLPRRVWATIMAGALRAGKNILR